MTFMLPLGNTPHTSLTPSMTQYEALCLSWKHKNIKYLSFSLVVMGEDKLDKPWAGLIDHTVRGDFLKFTYNFKK